MERVLGTASTLLGSVPESVLLRVALLGPDVTSYPFRFFGRFRSYSSLVELKPCMRIEVLPLLLAFPSCCWLFDREGTLMSSLELLLENC